MAGASVPAATGTSVEHADWLELEALRAADRNSSPEDLMAALGRTGSAEEIRDEHDSIDQDDGVELEEPIAEAATAELEDRSLACGGAYPFRVETSYIQGNAGTSTSLYAFLLLLSEYGIAAAPPDLNAAKLFEDISELALAHALGGAANGVQTYQFGFPRRVQPAGFRDALDDLCVKLGEGEGASDSPTTANQKDGTLDLVGWIPFPDQREGSISVWGQCATGSNWVDKASEMRPDNFAKKWMRKAPAVDPLRALFVPHRVRRDRWRDHAVDAGLLFDRCRITVSARRLPRPLKLEVARYCRHVIAKNLR